MEQGQHVFTVLGGFDLVRADGTRIGSILAQPKRVAFLTYLALEGERSPVQRDELLGVFWPDSEESKARGSLNSMLHYLRRSLGSDAVTSSGTLVALDPTRVRTDAVLTRQASRDGRYDEVLELYGGELLPGLHLGTPPFEDWVSARRRELRRTWIDAAVVLARERPDDHDLVAPLERILVEAPGEEAVALLLIQHLHRSHGRAAAMAAWERWKTRLADRLELKPSEEAETAVRAIASEPSLEGFSPPEGAGPVDADALKAAVSAPATAGKAETSRAPPTEARRSGEAVVVIAALVVLGVGIVRLFVPTEEAVPGGLHVHAFDPGDQPGHLADLVPSLIARHMEESGEVAAFVWDPPAGLGEACPRRLPADRSRRLTGAVVSEGEEGVLLRACLFDTRGRREGIEEVSLGTPDVRAAAATLATALWERMYPGRPFRRAPPLSRAPGALAAFGRGESLRRRGDFRGAIQAYSDAVSLDSTFAWAHYRLSSAYEWVGMAGASRVAAGAALAHSDRFAAHERELFQGWLALVDGDVRTAFDVYRRLVRGRPHDPEVHYRRGELGFHWGTHLGVPRDSADRWFQATLSGIPDHVPSLFHRARHVARFGTLEELEAVGRRVSAAGADGRERLEVDVLLAARRGDTAALATLAPQWFATGELPGQWVELVSALAGDVPDPTPMVGLLRSVRQEEALRETGRRWAIVLSLASAGRFREALAEARALDELNPHRAVEAEVMLAMVPSAPFGRDDLVGLRERLRALPEAELMGARAVYLAAQGVFLPRRIFLDAYLTHRIDSTLVGDVWAERARDARDRSQPDFARFVEILAAEARGRPEAVLSEMGSVWIPPERLRPDLLSYPTAWERWIRVRALLALGRDAEALQWLGTYPDASGYDIPFMAPVDIMRGEILERRGDDARAGEAYRRALALWSGADSAPALEAWRVRARSGLRRLDLSGS